MDLHNLLEDVKRVAILAGEETLKYYKNDLANNIYYKDLSAPYTKADIEAEKIILAGLSHYDYGILSEETVEQNNRLEKKRVWVVDPLDGTVDFIQETQDFCIVIGLVEDGRVILGVIYQPVLGMLYFATLGGGAYSEILGQVPTRLFINKPNFDSLKMLVSRNHLLELDRSIAKIMGVKDLVARGSAGLKLGLLSAGLSDLYLNTSNKTAEWDICAGSLILQEAGGVIRDLSGNNFLWNKKNPVNLHGFVAGSKEIVDSVISVYVQITNS